MLKTEKRIVSGVFVGFISFGFTFLQSILLVPILLTLWGTETYGIWLVLNAGYIILQTLDSGQQAYIGNEFNIKYFSDKMELRVALASSLRMAFVIGGLQLLIVLFLILSNTTHLFLGLSAISVSKEYLIICLLLLILSWISSGTYVSILSKLMIPLGYYSKSIWWGVYSRLGAFIVLIVIALNKGSILDATIGITLFSISINVLFLFRIKHLMPEVYPWWHFGNWKTGWINLKRSSLLSISSILYQFSNNGLLILITYLFGAATVPLYSTMRTLTNSAVSITNLIIQPLQPEIVRFRVQNELKKIIEIFDVNWLISGVIINMGILMILPFIHDIYQIWTRSKLEFDLPLFLLLSISVSFFNFGSVLVFYLHSLNKIKYQFNIIVLKLFLIFSISILLSNIYGLTAVGIGLAIAELIAYIIIPYWYIKREFILNGLNISITRLFIRLLPIFTMILIFVVVIILPNYILYLSIVGILILGILYSFSWLALSPEVREKLASFLGLININGD